MNSRYSDWRLAPSCLWTRCICAHLCPTCCCARTIQCALVQYPTGIYSLSCHCSSLLTRRFVSERDTTHKWVALGSSVLRSFCERTRRLEQLPLYCLALAVAAILIYAIARSRSTALRSVRLLLRRARRLLTRARPTVAE